MCVYGILQSVKRISGVHMKFGTCFERSQLPSVGVKDTKTKTNTLLTTTVSKTICRCVEKKKILIKNKKGVCKTARLMSSEGVNYSNGKGKRSG